MANEKNFMMQFDGPLPPGLEALPNLEVEITKDVAEKLAEALGGGGNVEYGELIPMSIDDVTTPMAGVAYVSANLGGAAELGLWQLIDDDALRPEGFKVACGVKAVISAWDDEGDNPLGPDSIIWDVIALYDGDPHVADYTIEDDGSISFIVPDLPADQEPQILVNIEDSYIDVILDFVDFNDIIGIKINGISIEISASFDANVGDVIDVTMSPDYTSVEVPDDPIGPYYKDDLNRWRVIDHTWDAATKTMTFTKTNVVTYVQQTLIM